MALSTSKPALLISFFESQNKVTSLPFTNELNEDNSTGSTPLQPVPVKISSILKFGAEDCAPCLIANLPMSLPSVPVPVRGPRVGDGSLAGTYSENINRLTSSSVFETLLNVYFITNKYVVPLL